MIFVLILTIGIKVDPILRCQILFLDLKWIALVYIILVSLESKMIKNMNIFGTKKAIVMSKYILYSSVFSSWNVITL